MKIVLTGTILLTGIIVAAQDSTKGNLALTGSVDAYYRFNLHNAKDLLQTNNYTSFTNSQNSFELGMASLKAEYAKNKVSGTLDLGFGRRAQEFSYNDSGIRAAIKQAYISYAPSEHVRITMGKWATHIGYELVDVYLNRNYSMSYMFSYGPFFHTGIKADFVFNNIGFMAGLANPTDMLTASFARKFIVGQFSAGTIDGKLKGYLNYAGGKYPNDVSVSQVDLVVNGTLSSQLSIGYNGTVQLLKPWRRDSDSWWASALYFNYDLISRFGITLRGEYFDDKKGVSGLAAATSVATSVFAVTLSGNVKIDNLLIIPEFRLDAAKDAIFVKNNNELVKSSGSFIVAVAYHF